MPALAEPSVDTWTPRVTARAPGLRGRNPLHPIHELLPYVHHYFDGGVLPPSPATFDLSGGYTAWGMLGNGPDATLTVNGGRPVGDCGFAGWAHLLMVTAIALGLPIPPFTADQVVAEYLRYDHGQDRGVDIVALLAFASKVGVLGAKVLGFGKLPVADPQLRWDGVYLFGGGYTGIVEPAAAQRQFADGRPWRLTGTPADRQLVGGHCVVDVARLHGGGVDITWGADQAFTDEWDRTYRQTVLVAVTTETAEAAARGGMDVDAYLADLRRLEAVPQPWWGPSAA